MNIVDFCRSPYGHGLTQSKLYRKLKQHVNESIRKQIVPPLRPLDQNFPSEGFRVRENEQRRLHYEIYDPARFQVLARTLAGWQMPGPEEVLDLLEAARLLVQIARHEHPHLQLRSQTGSSLIPPREQQLIERAERIVVKALPG